jgi:hypothetical protein
MKRYLGYAIILSLFAAPALLAQDQSDQVEVGVFAEYLRMTDVTPTQNVVGLGGRAAFSVHLSMFISARSSQHSTGGGNGLRF